MYMAGMCQFRQILDYDRDQTAAHAAVKQLEMLVEVFPNSPYAAKALCKIAEAKKHIAEYEFFVGSFYLKKNNYLAAYARFDKLLLQYPNSLERDRVLLAMGKTCLYDGQTEKGKRILQLLLKNYPDGVYVPDAEKLLAMY
jgi:outer membrane protein assembly factor BamD